MKKFLNKYRGTTTRARFWDYGWNAAYFVTICTRDRECFFGDVVDGRMELSPIGHIANSCWHEIPKHFPFVVLGAHVIMPDHVHGIIIINKPDDGRNHGQMVGAHVGNPVRGAKFCAPDRYPKNQFGPQSQNLASIIRGFKIGVTKNARQINPHFAWQPRYHDHIIRNEKSFYNISRYIINNPGKWARDKSR
ncbi:transposase [Thermophagus sp. OGC60D27]|uniref:transposase n=1 Tax=Thermophagus sp. OGC60D27 TaxID=3458415 RepID=UPI004037F7D6